MGLRDDVLAERITTNAAEVMPLDGTGKIVWIRKQSGAEREAMEAAIDKRRDKDGKLPEDGLYRATIAAHVLCEADGRRVFDDADIPELAKLPSKVLMMIAARDAQLNGLRAVDVEALEKN